MSTTTTEQDRTPRNPWTRWQFVTSLSFLGVVVLAGLIFSAVALIRDDPGPTGTGSACQRPASTDTALSGALAVDSWDTRGVAKVPLTPFGPSTTDPAPTCFEHSPSGAAVAAVYIGTLGSTGQTTTVLEHLATDSPATEAMASQVGSAEAVPTTVPTAVAVRLNDYRGDTASVSVVFDVAGFYTAGTINLVWEGGDWKWDTPTESLESTQVTSLTGYNRLPQEGTNG